MIGAGFGRTGTLSLKTALEDLGFGPTYHGEDLMTRWSDVTEWHRFALTGRADWDSLFRHFGSGVDWPVASAWRELADHYPDAKVILTVRDPESWWQSMYETVYQARTMLPAWVPAVVPTTRRYLEMTDRLIWEGLFDERFEDKSHAIKVFEHHLDEVTATVPAERLLVYGVGEGWEPLCRFLGVPVPAHEFPHVNDTVRMKRWIAGIRVGFRAVPAAVAAGAAVGLGRQLARAGSRAGAVNPAGTSRP